MRKPVANNFRTGRHLAPISMQRGPASNPGDLRFIKVRGRGSAQLIGHPRSNRGRAVVHIADPKGGRENYIFDLQWRGSGGGPPMDRWVAGLDDSLWRRLFGSARMP